MGIQITQTITCDLCGATIPSDSKDMCVAMVEGRSRNKTGLTKVFYFCNSNHANQWWASFNPESDEPLFPTE